VVVEDKKGKKRVVGDRSAMYVDEAWVGRGKYESGSDHRARGQIHRLRLPYTSESFVLLLLLSWLPNTEKWCRYLCCAEGGSDEDTAGGGEGGEEAEEEGLGAVTG